MIETREQRLDRLDRERRELVARAAELAAAERERRYPPAQLTLPGVEPAWSRGLADPPPS